MTRNAIAIALLVFMTSMAAAPGASADEESILCPDTYLAETVTVPVDFPPVGLIPAKGHAWVFHEENREATQKSGKLVGRACTEDITELVCDFLRRLVDPPSLVCEEVVVTVVQTSVDGQHTIIAL